MGLRFKKSFGPKGFKINVGKRGISSASLKIAPGLTINSKRGVTVGIPGTGISYNTGGKKPKKVSTTTNTSTTNNTRYTAMVTETRNLKIEKQKAYNRKFKEFTGGYNKKAIIAIIISFILCVTPLWPLGLVLAIPFLAWFAIDTIIKIIKFNKYLKNVNKSLYVDKANVKQNYIDPRVATIKEEKELTFRAAGITFNGIQGKLKAMVKDEKEIGDSYEGLSNKEILEAYSEDDKIYEVEIAGSNEIKLILEPENKFDINAIRIVLDEVGDIGYVPANDCKRVKKILEYGYSIQWQLIGGKHKYIEYDEEKDKDVVRTENNTYGIMITLTEI